MKTAIIIHGMPDEEEYRKDPQCSARENQHWMQWIKNKLISEGIAAETPIMPVPYNPEYEAWKTTLEQFPINEDTILIGHSCGGGLIVRYLSENNVKVGKVILVAPWLDPTTFLSTGMFNFTIDKNIASKTKGLTIFNSSNDDEEIQESVRRIITATKDGTQQVKVVSFENMGHFCYGDMGTDAFPELLTEALS